MRILLYNWVPFDDLERRGGGIRIYQASLVRQLLGAGHQVDTVSGGLEHDRLDPSVRIERHPPQRRGQVRSYRLVNSPVMAPGHHCFGTDQLFTTGPALEAWHDFLRTEGPWDVVQFDSLEGLPFTFLRVHEVLPEARVLLYAHNYYTVCPQVNLWKNESSACEDFHEGRDCVGCLPHPVDQGEVRRAHQLSRLLRSAGVTPGTSGYRAAYAAYARLKHYEGALSTVTRTVVGGMALTQRVRSAVEPRLSRVRQSPPERRSDGRARQKSDDRSEDRVVDAPAGSSNGTRPAPAPAGPPTMLPLAEPLHRSAPFLRRRVEGTALINREVDAVLATSHRTAEVLAARGIDRDRIRVTYIGSRAAEPAGDHPRRTTLHTPGVVTAAYLGYMRRDKGFHHLVEALARAPDDALRKIRLVVAARVDDPPAFERLRALADRTAGVWHHDGYDHDDLATILEPVDVGLVPVQWEDNLPQVAMEMVGHGIPLLTSDRGGASELGGDHPDWIFGAEDHAELVDRLVAVADGRIPLASYWTRSRAPRGMAEHLADLLTVYGDRDAEPRDRDAEPRDRDAEPGDTGSVPSPITPARS